MNKNSVGDLIGWSTTSEHFTTENKSSLLDKRVTNPNMLRCFLISATE